MTKMNPISFLRIPAAAVAALLLTSCDKDFNEIGADIVGEDHFLFEKDDTFSIVANTVPTGPVQSNNLPVNPLGVLENPNFGRTVASFVTQLEIKSLNPLFDTYDTDPEIVSTTLYVPYFSTLESTNTDGSHEYVLDSIFGTEQSSINLAIHESNYFLRDFQYNSEGEQESQRYYTNQAADIESTINPLVLNDGEISQNQSFVFSREEYEEQVTNANGSVTTKRTRPGLKVSLNNDFFEDKIFNAPDGILGSNNAFKNYFRGLYFKVTPNGQPGELAMMNFREGTVTIKYKETQLDSNFQPIMGDDGNPKRIDKEFVLNLAGNTVSLLQNDNVDPQYASALAQPFDAVNGHMNLALKGGEGSIAVIDLFGPDEDGNGVADELEAMRENEWMINEASLTFNINKDPDYMGTTTLEPERIYLYDLTNKRPVVDYYLDNSTGGIKSGKTVHGGLVRRVDGQTVSYKVRITNYIRNLVKAPDSTNVRLGLAVTESINVIDMAKQRNPSPESNNFVPSASVMNPLGTFLYGTHPNVPIDKRLKLEIYYTKRKPTDN